MRLRQWTQCRCFTGVGEEMKYLVELKELKAIP